MKLHKILDYSILLTLILSIVLFIIFPIFSVIRLSLWENGVFTLQYYKELLTPDHVKLIGNSLWVSLLSSSFTTFFAFCIALYGFTLKNKKKFLLKSSLMLTMISPPFVSALALIMLFGRRGLITYGIFGLSVNPYGWQGIVLLQTIGSISFAALMLFGSFEKIDMRQIWASSDLGAKPFSTLTNIIIPSITPGILSVFFILFTINMADFGTPIIIGGRYQVLATEAYLQVLSSPHLGKAAAMSLLMIPPAIFAFYFYRKNLNKTNHLSQGDKLSFYSATPYQLPKSIKIPLQMVVFLFFFIMFLKYGNIFLSTISNTATGTIQFTTKNISNLPRSQIASFWHSISYSLIAAIIASFLGVLLSYYAHRREIFGMKIMEFMASLPYVIPGTFFGLGYVAAFSKEPFLLRETAWIIILNFSFRQLSVSNKSANAEFNLIDQKIEHAAQDLGASKLQVLIGILFPQLTSTFLTCFVTTFTSSMMAFGAIIFLISPSNNVASVELFHSIENGRYGVAAVQAVMLILVTLVVNILSMYLLERSKKHVPEVFSLDTWSSR